MGTEQGDSVDARRRAGRVIRQARQLRGWTAGTAYKKAGLSERTYTKIETGVTVRDSSLVSVARLFDISPNVLVNAMHCQGGYQRLATHLGVELNGGPLGQAKAIDTRQLATLLAAALTEQDGRSATAQQLLDLSVKYLAEGEQQSAPVRSEGDD